VVNLLACDAHSDLCECHKLIGIMSTLNINKLIS
jgi:hypothetical protein